MRYQSTLRTQQWMSTLPIDEYSTVLVTGATGFVGRALIQELSSLGCHIKVLARTESQAEAIAYNYQADLYVGDILAEDVLRDACDEVTHVFHLAGQGQSREHDDDETHRVNLEGTKLLAKIVAEERQLKRFLHLSSTAVHGNITNGPADETAAFAAQGSYGVSKLAAEQWLWDFAAQSQLPITVLRPCAIIGPGDRRLLKLFKMAKRSFIPLPGGGQNRYQFIHIDDCVRIILAAAQAENAIGQAYICGNAETLLLREILQVIHAAGVPGTTQPKVLTLPLALIKTILGYADALWSVFGATSPLAAERLSFFEHNHWFTTTKMHEELGIELQHDNVQALQATHDWYRTNHWL